MNHPFNDKGAAERLLQEYRKYKTLIVGFDFDNTIFDYHQNGGDYSEVVELLRECRRLRFNLCLFTIEDRIDWKYKVCCQLGIKPDYVNESPVIFENGGNKPYFNILLDDRAGLESAYKTLKQVVDYANTESDEPGQE